VGVARDGPPEATRWERRDVPRHLRADLIFSMLPKLAPEMVKVMISEADEDILAVDVPDEALERAASVEQQAFTLVYCTHHWHTYDWPQ